MAEPSLADHAFVQRLRSADLIRRSGRVTRILPTAIEADGPSAPLGAICSIETRTNETGPRETGSILAQVVGVDRGAVTLAPFEAAVSTFPGAEVVSLAGLSDAPVGDSFLGRVVDAFGRPLDGGGPILAEFHDPLGGSPTSPLERTTPATVLETGLRAIDGLLTLGQGQRVGVFAASGVGKTTLMGQLARGVQADRLVICLVGERGREVEALWADGLSPAAKARATLVAATADQSAAMRVRAAHYALALAAHWRARGQHVLLLLDSVTRLAMALREIGLAAGEPPTVRAYPPSVFSVLPYMVERCGALRSGGAITAILTVLAETDDVDDPITELMKSLLDGHIVLSRVLAEQGQFPAIDAPRSVSRLADAITPAGERALAREALTLLSTYETSRTLIETGVYTPGANADIDRALDRRDGLRRFLCQSPREQVSLADCRVALAAALEGGRAP
jgi:flagellum-specific ATP synthase